MGYVLDTNVFIESKNRYYAFDIAPKFWTSLVQHGLGGTVHSIDRVKDELLRGNDDLAVWVKDTAAHLFVSTDDNQVIAAYRDIMQWVQSAAYLEEAKTMFAGAADGWVIAYAKASGRTVVSHETRADPASRRRVKIPDVCDAFSIPYIGLFQMLRDLGIVFS